MYKVDNAIIMAAGMSSRFVPLSYETHKGLLPVKGEILIERQIRQLHGAGISDITLVTGYRKEDFRYLHDKFNVEIVENDDFYRYNNPSSLIRVVDRLKNTYICSCDNYFAENVFESTVDQAYYAASFFPGESSEWGLLSDASGRITGINHSPKDMWCMMGHVFFSSDFSSRFKRILIDEYANETTRKKLWESIYEEHLNELDMYVRKYPVGIIYEFDSLDDLRQFDDTYVDNSGSEVLRTVCAKIGCRERDVTQIETVKSETHAFRFAYNGKAFVYNVATGTIQGDL